MQGDQLHEEKLSAHKINRVKTGYAGARRIREIRVCSHLAATKKTPGATCHGVLFKCKVDVLNLEKGFFTDIKTTKDLEPSWSKEHRTFMPFYENWNYWRQLAIYQELIFQNTGKKLQPFIAVSSKQKPYYFDVLEVAQYDDGSFQERLEHELDKLEDEIEFMLDPGYGQKRLSALAAEMEDLEVLQRMAGFTMEKVAKPTTTIKK